MMDAIPSLATTDLIRFTGTWKLDPQRTSITFRTKAMWLLPVNGTVKALSGEAVVAPGAGVKGTLVIDAASFDTKNKKRDNHLRTDHFLNSATYPTIVFEATTVRPGRAGLLEVKGQLTVRGHSQPLVLHAEISGSDSAATVTTNVEIDRSLWGITWGSKMGVRLKSQVTIRALFVRA